MRIESFYVSFPVSEKYKGDIDEELRNCLRTKFPSFALVSVKYLLVERDGKNEHLSKRTKT